MAGTFELRDASGGQFMFNLKAANGEIILTSETYVARAGATNGIASVRTNAPIDARYERGVARDKQHYFVLKAANGERIGRSETYTSASAMEKGIASVKANAPSAVIKDLTRSR